MNVKKNLNLVLPALRAHIGDWIYYITFLKMKDIAARISVADEIHESTSLNDLIQRSLSDRSQEIKDYLATQEQRFFNTIVIGVYGGTPSWYEIDITGNNIIASDELPSYIDGTVGILNLENPRKLFAIDGQHRVIGIRKAIEDNVEIGNEEVSVVFVSHKNTEDGLARTRRLFTTLNRYSKPVGKYDTIALDEDDIVAIITRNLVNNYPLFQHKKVSPKRTKSLLANDKYSFTTLISIYDVMDIFLRDKDTSMKKWKEFKKYRPSDEIINQYEKQAKNLWNGMCDHFPSLLDLKNSTQEQAVAQKYRNSDGGNLLFRPIGLQIFIKALKNIENTGKSLDESIQFISKIPTELSSSPWTGLLWDNTNKRMLTAANNQKVALQVIINGLDGDLSTLKTDSDSLRKEMAGLLNRNEKEIELPKFV